MPADLRLVVGSAERDALELEPDRPRDRLAERGLADARRPDEAQDRAASLRVELAHREVLEDALLDLVEPVVVGLEDFARTPDVDVLRGERRPRQRRDELEVGAQHRVLGALLRHALQPLQLLADLLERFGRDPRGLDRVTQPVDLRGTLLGVAEFVLDLLELLAQHGLLLALVDGLAGLRLDAARQAQHLDALREQRRDALEAHAQVERLEYRLALRRLHIEEARDQVAERLG